MNEQEELISDVYEDGTMIWRLKNSGHLHKINGPAVEYISGKEEWYLYGVPVDTTQLELSVGQAITWSCNGADTIALVIKQINHTLFQVLIGNKKEYLFSLYNTKDIDTFSISLA